MRPRNPDLPLLLVSIVALFLELFLIRWLSKEVTLFSYLQNLVLIACFMGLGLGSLTCRRHASMYQVLMPLAVLMVTSAIPALQRQMTSISNLIVLTQMPGVWTKLMTFRDPHQTWMGTYYIAVMYVVLSLVVCTFIPLGRHLGRMLEDNPHTVRAYSVNIGGSLLGIWLFVGLGVLCQPPVVWLAVLLALIVVLESQLYGTPTRVTAVVSAVILLAGFCAHRDPDDLAQAWSPYQQLIVTHARDTNPWSKVGDYIVWVNDAPYQCMMDLRPQRMRAEPNRFPADMVGHTQYDIPAQLALRPGSALIVGAAKGNDTAGLLRNGIGDVTAVEIDPQIVRLGRQFHPEHPYDDPRVHIVVDDARSYFANCTRKFDLIVFGLLDAHSAVSMTNTRLDHYVYTLESVRQARSLLAPGGVMTVCFEVVLNRGIPERINQTLQQVFGHDPFWFRIPFTNAGWGGLMFVASDQPQAVLAHLHQQPELEKKILEWHAWYELPRGLMEGVATDDWPYLYLSRPSIPEVYYTLLGLPVLILAFMGFGQVRALARGWDTGHTHFFLLGAAFMLLESHSISRACVCFGSTWLVNAVVITGVLTLILLSNLLALRFPQIPMLGVYALLIASCVVLYAVNLARFAFLPFAVKATVVGTLSCLPMLFSGLVFIQSFAHTQDRDKALGANLLGALVGGLLQSLSFLFGLRALTLLVGVLYLLSYFFRPAIPARAV